jgi:hypothetical protein
VDNRGGQGVLEARRACCELRKSGDVDSEEAASERSEEWSSTRFSRSVRWRWRSASW